MRTINTLRPTSEVRESPTDPDGAPRALDPVNVRWLRSASVPRTAMALLDDQEIDRLQRIQNPEVAQDYLAAHVAARTTIGAKIGVHPAHVRFIRGMSHRGGTSKPVVAGADLHFSLSHSRGIGIVALSETMPVGVDSEHRSRGRNTHLLGRILAHRERPCNPGTTHRDREMLLVTWTRKEAMLKALGTGLSIDPQKVVVAADSVCLFPAEPSETHIQARTESFTIDSHHICAVSSLAPDVDLRIAPIELTPALWSDPLGMSIAEGHA